MGILQDITDLAKAVAEIRKQAPIVSPIQNIGNTTSYGNSVGLQRDETVAGVPFSPGNPIIPGAINIPRSDGRPDPRRYEFQVAQNINITETRLVPFKTLRAAAEQIDILRRCVEVMKAKVTGLKWDVVLSDDTVESVAAESGLSPLRAQQAAKEKFGPKIAEARAFWKTPDPANGLIFSDWLSMALEDILVLDAWAVWPQKTVGGDLHGLQVLDGSTIKPLIDARGMRPNPPFPAFQQILFGFPRSEFNAPDETDEADGEFSSDELSYLVRNRRTTSVYGYGPVERALPMADLYLRRQQWMRAEYTDGVLPDLMFKTDSNFGNNPDLLRAYENVFNDSLAGQTEQRHKGVVLPAGIDPIQFTGYAEKLSHMAFDEYLVNSICGHFGVMPTEIGFAPKGGLGGAGHQQGEASSSEVIGLVPLTQWLGQMLSHLSYIYLGMPRELEFRFMPSERKDDSASAQADDLRQKNGTLSINEARAKAGLPLLETSAADMPMLVTTAGNYFVTEDGLVDLSTGVLTDAEKPVDRPEPTDGATPATAETAQTDAEKPPATDEKPKPSKPANSTAKGVTSDLEATRETKAFLRWLQKSPTRAFEFRHLPIVYAETLNKFIELGDTDGARWYAERYLA